MSLLSNCSQNACIWHALVDQIARAVTKWTRSCDRRLARLTAQVNSSNIVMWNHNADWDCFKTLFLREILKTQNPLLEEHFAFFEGIHLFH